MAAIAEKKAKLDALRPLSHAALAAVQKAYDVELTYTSNAIEGNTLTLRETAQGRRVTLVLWSMPQSVKISVRFRSSCINDWTGLTVLTRE